MIEFSPKSPPFAYMPTLQEAFLEHDHSMLSFIVMKDKVKRAFPSKTDTWYKYAQREVGLMFDTMCKMDVLPGQNMCMLLLPSISYGVDARELVVRRWVDAALFDAQDAFEEGRLDNEANMLEEDVCDARASMLEEDSCDVDASMFEERFRMQREVEIRAFDQASYAGLPWEQVLSWRVMLPWYLSEREVYMMLASAFWEMTFYKLEYKFARACAGVRAEESIGKSAHAVADKSASKSAHAVADKSADESIDEGASVGESIEEGAGTDTKKVFVQEELKLSSSIKSKKKCELESGWPEPGTPRYKNLSGFFRQLHHRSDEERLDRTYIERLAQRTERLNRKARMSLLDLEVQLARSLDCFNKQIGET